MLHTNNGAIHEKRNSKTFGFGKEKFSAKVRLDTKMPGVPIILSKSVYQKSRNVQVTCSCTYDHPYNWFPYDKFTCRLADFSTVLLDVVSSKTLLPW